jgi:hypothetical protein
MAIRSSCSLAIFLAAASSLSDFILFFSASNLFLTSSSARLFLASAIFYSAILIRSSLLKLPA